ncbi:MAG: hypothetical protein GY838_15590 [bacterium]|nr:hypothetical protein [bacterium]
MTEHCPSVEELGDLRGLSADDPRAVHAAACPRCQALLAALDSFLDPTDPPTTSDLPDARTRLDAALEQEIHGTSTNVVRPQPHFWTPFRVRTVAAAAAVLLVAVGLTLVDKDPWIPGSDPVLRGGDETAAPFPCVVEVLDSGDHRLSWPTVAEADAYTVVVFSADLEELARLEAGASVTMEVATPADAAFCHVLALRGGDEIERSEAAYLR